METKQEVLNHPEAAEYLRMSVRALYRAGDKGDVPFVKVGGRRKYSLAKLRRLIEGESA